MASDIIAGESSMDFDKFSGTEGLGIADILTGKLWKNPGVDS